MLARIALGPLVVLAALAARGVAQDPDDAPSSRPALNLDRADPLGDLSSRMQVITKHLFHGETGSTVQPKEVDAIEQLDALIAVLKKKSGS